MAFNRHLKNLTDEIEYNKKLSEEYFDSMAELMTNNDKIIELLESYTENRYYGENLKFCKTNETQTEIHCMNYTFFKDSITGRKQGKDFGSVS